MEFSKIKHHKGTVELEWSTDNDSDSVKHSLRSFDEPEKEFADALQALGPIVCRLLRFAPDYVEGLTVIGVSLSHNDSQGRGCVVNSLKELGDFNAPLVLNTPHLPEDAEQGPTMPTDLSRALDTLEEYAMRYRNGQRLQSDLFAEEVAHA